MPPRRRNDVRRRRHAALTSSTCATRARLVPSDIGPSPLSERKLLRLKPENISQRTRPIPTAGRRPHVPESEDLVSPERARIYAGASTWLWLDLIALGLVRPVRRGALDLYSKAAIGQLIARLRKYAGPDVDPALYFSISQASRATGIRPAVIVKMILARELRFVATDPYKKGFDSILLDMSEICGSAIPITPDFRLLKPLKNFTSK